MDLAVVKAVAAAAQATREAAALAPLLHAERASEALDAVQFVHRHLAEL